MGSSYATAAVSSAVKCMNVAIERLATGKRINVARDDAAGVAICSKIESNIRGVSQAVRNSLDAQSLLDTAEGGLKGIENLLQRIRELALQAANDTNTEIDIENLNLEAQNLLESIKGILCTTEWAGQTLLDGSFVGKSMLVDGSATKNSNLQISIPNIFSNNELFDFCNDTNNQFNSIIAVGKEAPAERFPEIIVNQTTNSNQERPVISKLSNGDTVIGWTSNQDSWGEGIYARIFDADGKPKSAEFQVNQTEIFNQREPSIDAIGDGYFVATWSTMEEDGIRWDIKGRIFDNSGNFVTDEFKINQEKLFSPGDPLSQGLPSVIRVDDSSFFVSWNSTLDSIGRFFNNDGTPKGDQFTLNRGIRPVAGMLDQSTIIVASSNNYSIKLSSISIRNENTVSQTIIADDSDGNRKFDPRLSTLPDGGFAVAWGEYDATSNKYNISCKIFDSQGQPTSDELHFSSDDSVNATRPSLVSLSNNDILITWQETNVAGKTALFAQRISPTGAPYGEAKVIASHKDFENLNLVGDKTIIETSEGNLSLVWTSSGGVDGSGNAVLLKGLSFNEVTASIDSAAPKLRVDDDAYISIIDKLLEDLGGLRSYIGASSNRLEYVVSINTNVLKNLSISMGRIEDADFAMEATVLAKNEIMKNASMAVLAQANASKNNILELIRHI